MVASTEASPWLGEIDYASAMEIVADAHARVKAGGKGELFLLSHPPTITLGRHAQLGNVVSSESERAEAGVHLVQSDRGGDVTLHDPHQLMIYPVVHIARQVRRFLRDTATAIAAAAQEFGVSDIEYTEDPAGLWWFGRKIAACGIAVRDGVTTHGFALNVATPPALWRHIVPCGDARSRPVSMQEAAGRELCVPDVAAVVAPRVREALGLPLGNVAAAG